MRNPFPIEKLEVWQDARKLVAGVYDCARSFPKEERFGLASQMTRAAVSAANNLAEGGGRATLKDQANYSSQAHGSLMGTASDLFIAVDLRFMSEGVTRYSSGSKRMILPFVPTISETPNCVASRNSENHCQQL